MKVRVKLGLCGTPALCPICGDIGLFGADADAWATCVLCDRIVYWGAQLRTYNLADWAAVRSARGFSYGGEA